MAERTFSLSSGMDLSIRLSIDTDVLTPEWTGEPTDRRTPEKPE